MQVVGDVDRFEVEQALEVRQVRFEGAICQQILEIAGVRRHVRPPAAGQGEGVLELGADGQHGRSLRHRDRQRDRFGGVAAGAADQALPAIDDAGHGVVVPGPDLAIVGQERVGDAGQPLQRLVVVGSQRLV